MLPATFWTIPDMFREIDGGIACGIDLSGRPTTRCSIQDYMKLFRHYDYPAISEFTQYAPLTKAYFEVKVKRDLSKNEDQVLKNALDFLRKTINTDKYVVSESHTPLEIVFSIICPLIAVHRANPLDNIARSGTDYGFQFYSQRYSWMRMGMGEERPMTFIRPVPGYVGTFSDYVVQAPSPYARFLVPSKGHSKGIIQAIYRLSSSPSIQEELIAEVDFEKVTCSNRMILIEIMKSHNLESLFHHKMCGSDLLNRPHYEKHLKSGWSHAPTSSLSHQEQVNLIYNILKEQRLDKRGDEIIAKYHFVREDPVKEKIVQTGEVIKPIVIQVSLAPILGLEERRTMIELLNEKIESLTRTRDALLAGLST